MGSNPWTYILIFIVVIAAGATGFGVLFSLLIARVGTSFAEKTQSAYQREIENMLPGKNCGQCGFENCAAYADAVLHTEADEDLCPHGKEGLAEEMVACRGRLQAIMEDPTPPKVREKKKTIWDKKY